MTENIKVKQDDAVLEIIFARPDKKRSHQRHVSHRNRGS